MAPHKLRALDRLLRHFRSVAAPIGLPNAGEIDPLLPGHGRAGSLLLDYYAPEDVREAFDRYGVSSRLRDRGFERVGVVLDTRDPGRQAVRVGAEREGRRVLLGELFVRRGEFATEASFAPALHGSAYRMLFIQWLRLQDPTRRFTPERPALPGQAHPGLGVGREVMAMLHGMARRLELEGILVCPEFAHNAVLYAGSFRFFDPAAQGRFEALCDAARGMALAQMAWGVAEGCFIDPDDGEPFRWSREEMLCPETDALRGHLESEAYRAAAAAARSAFRCRFDPARLERRRPLHPDGSPRHPPEEGEGG
jgi:hypothetical protein